MPRILAKKEVAEIEKYFHILTNQYVLPHPSVLVFDRIK
jgi:hypothetical protein